MLKPTSPQLTEGKTGRAIRKRRDDTYEPNWLTTWSPLLTVVFAERHGVEVERLAVAAVRELLQHCIFSINMASTLNPCRKMYAQCASQRIMVLL